MEDGWRLEGSMSAKKKGTTGKATMPPRRFEDTASIFAPTRRQPDDLALTGAHRVGGGRDILLLLVSHLASCIWTAAKSHQALPTRVQRRYSLISPTG